MINIECPLEIRGIIITHYDMIKCHVDGDYIVPDDPEISATFRGYLNTQKIDTQLTGLYDPGIGWTTYVVGNLRELKNGN